ncbi:DNA polymerase I [uncultured Clostridium sp.]|uniref:DNA polymerase I n=1 Tax=uncultured Clostridium sp. TaxID=59620 RepID=UPI00260E1E55|nr:DNA polymerase I [uncultured Clostridium sp.]
MERLLILDSNALMNRAFFAIPQTLTNSEGIHTNAIYGFVNMLIKMKEDIKPNYIIATFDKKAPTFRHKEYKDYKAGRKKMAPELYEQFPIIKELFEYLGIDSYELEGFEADDLIGTIAKEAARNNIEVFIVTGDKDALQLADKNINVVITKKGVSEVAIYNEESFIEEFGVTPTQFIDVKGLMGDKSDNIPGVPGVGEKTAFKLIKDYGSVENVLENIENISGKKLKENLSENREQAIFSKRLATIEVNVPITGIMEAVRGEKENNKTLAKELLLKLGMNRNTITKLVGEEDVKEKEIEVVQLLEEKEIKEFLNSEEKFFISYSENHTPLNSERTLNNIYFGNKNKVTKIDIKEVGIETLKEFFENENIEKIIHDGKALVKILKIKGIEIKGFNFDTAIGAYIIDSSRGDYAIDKVAAFTIFEEVKGENPEEILLNGSIYLEAIEKNLKEKIIKDNMEELYYNIEHPLIFVLANMENEGFRIDKEVLNELQVKFKGELDRTESEIYELSEEKFNINSPKQLGVILFEKLDLRVIKKTKTGYSTNVDVLNKLKDDHPIIEKIIYYRQISKIYSTYVEGLKNLIDTDGKIHTNFNQTVTTTGRLSSTEPNLQNIPIRYDMGREVRKVFIPEVEGDILLSLDYSQIELRVLAHISEDENMIDAFKHHSDIHTKTAAEVFNVSVNEVTSLMRSRAKAVNFGIVYGMSDFSLAQDLKITKKEASDYMEIYFNRYPKIKGYLTNVVEEAKATGICKTILNRKRFIPEIKSSNRIVKALGERLAMNAPIQGSAADIIKLAMINVENKLKEKGLESKLILQVHDELILNVKQSELEAVKELVKDEMENVLELKVPLEVDSNTGFTWYNLK